MFNRIKLRPLRRMGTVLLLAVAGILSMTTLASAATPAAARSDSGVTTQTTHACLFGPEIKPITFGQLDGRLLPNGDRIVATFQPGAVPAGQIRLQLSTAPSVTAYKALRGEDVSGTIIAEVSTQGADHGPNGFTRSLSILDKVFLIKAKTAGVHCAVYVLSHFELSQHSGEQVGIRWTAD